MRAAVFHMPGEKLQIREVAVPQPGRGQMLIKVQRCGICGSDLHMTDSNSCFHPASGAIIGHEFSGEVVALGEGVSPEWREGQRLTAMPYMGCGHCAQCLAGDPVWCAQVRSMPSGRAQGGFAEYTVVGAAESLRLPDSLSWEEGAFVEPVAVGIHAVAMAKLAPGARVLVVGAGAVGLAVAACARAAGAGPVCVTARTDSRADLACKMGATDFLLNDDQLAANFAKVAGGPPEVVFECVGLPGMLDLCAKLAAPRSTVVVLGACMQQERMMPILPTMKELRLQFVLCYSRRDFETALHMIETGRIDPLLLHTDTVDMSRFPDMFEALRQRSSQCKVLLSPGG